MNERTGLHINIGYENIKTNDFNILKGIVFMADTSKTDLPFVFKDMATRLNSEFTKSTMDKLHQIISEFDNIHRTTLINTIKKIDLHNLSDVEKKFNKLLLNILQGSGKKYGFNFFDHISKDNYIEYRYVGDSVPEKIVIDKMLYFCYITYLMIDPEYKKKEYYKKLYKFIDNLKDDIKNVSIEIKNRFLNNDN